MENVLFENSYEVTKSLIKSWRKVSQKRSGKLRLWLDLLFKIWSLVMAVSSAVVCFAFNLPSLVVMAGAFAGLFIMSIILPIITLHKQFKYFADLTGSSVWNQAIRFGEKIEVESGNSVSTYSYEQIRYVEENNDCFYLWLGVGVIIILYKNAFTSGDASDFSSYIIDKCSESMPLWTKRERNGELLKKQLPAVIILAVIVIGLPLYFCTVVVSSRRASGYESVSEAVKTQWSVSAQRIAEVEVQEGVVVFCSDEQEERVKAMLLKESDGRYHYITAHSYSIRDLTDYNDRAKYPFETDEETLAFASGKATVVYGVASKEWWNFAESQRQRYAVIPFSCGNKDYYLYYRIVDKTWI